MVYGYRASLGEQVIILTRVETDRLILRNFVVGDWQDLQKIIVRYQETEFAKYDHEWPTASEKIKEIVAWFAGGDHYLAVCLKTSGVLIGLLATNQLEEEDGRIHNLGFIFHPDYHGQGYAADGCRAAMDHIFSQLMADAIVTGTHPDNEPSVQLLKKLGIKEITQGEYGISKDEWLALDMNKINIVDRDMTSEELEQMRDGFDQNSLVHGVETQTADRYGFVAMKACAFIGCSSGLAYKNGDQYSGWFYLTDLFVEKEYRLLGVGTRLLSILEQKIFSMGVKHIWTWTAGYEAPNFYKKQGYIIFAELENWYADGSSKFGLRKKLIPNQ